MIRGTCNRARLLDLVENFTLFSEHKAGLVKIIGQCGEIWVSPHYRRRFEALELRHRMAR